MPSSLCKSLLRHARDNDGAATLSTIRTTVMTSVADNGRVMISASGGGKAYSFLSGTPQSDILAALDEAEGIYAQYEDDLEGLATYLDNLLKRAPIRKTVATF